MAERDHPIRQISAREHQALRRLEDHPALPALIPTLPPRALARLYNAVGLQEAGGLMALTPPALLARALDEAVWTSAGIETRFDPDTFVDWVEVWLQEGDDFTAERLLALDEEFLALCLGAVVRVEDAHVSGYARAPDEELGDPRGMEDDGVVLDRFLLTPVQEDEWHVVHEAVLALWSRDPDRTLALLERLAVGARGYVSVSVLQQDVASAREAKRDRAGFVAPAAAQAFLAIATTSDVGDLVAQSGYDLETARHMRQLRAATAEDTEAAGSGGCAPVPGAARAGDTASAGDIASAADTASAGDAASAGADAGIWHLLAAAGILHRPSPAGLITTGDGATLTLDKRLDELAIHDPRRLHHAAVELAYLANVLLGGIELDGSDARREDQARDLAFAAANLGVELLEGRALPVVLGEPPGLIRAFLVAWRTLAELPGAVLRAFEDAMASAAMAHSLETRDWLRVEMLASLRALEAAIADSRLEAAREAVTLLSLACNPDACRAAAHLLTRPPRFALLLEGGDKHASRWIRSVHDLARLGGVLARLGIRG